MAGRDADPSRDGRPQAIDGDSVRLRAAALLLLALDAALVWVVPRLGSAALDRALRDSYAETLRIFHSLRQRGVE